MHSSHLRCVPLRNVAVECTFTAKALKALPYIHSYLPPNSYPNSASSRTKRLSIEPSLVHSPVSQSRADSAKHPDEIMPARVSGIGEGRSTHELAGPVIGVGALKFRLKRSCVEKHVHLRCCRCCSSPRGNVVVERRSGINIYSYQSLALCSNSQCLG